MRRLLATSDGDPGRRPGRDRQAVAGELDRSDTYPDQIVAGLTELGVFGLTIDPEYGGLGESLLT